MTFVFVSGRPCLDFAGTLKSRHGPAPQELLSRPALLSDWARQARLLDTVIEVTDDDLAAALALREAIYHTVTARLERRRPNPPTSTCSTSMRPNARLPCACSEPDRSAARAPRRNCWPPWPRMSSTCSQVPISTTSNGAPTRAALVCT
ncbi:hypothetical protein I553_6392 [Mycobacterium xenopi 4042]|uniref:Uncharacterized protein n=1 Tax=Mycobacterium xenopi 4042 TaxID=1299334 RepID=X8BEH3_MYCXE|nr:hypothetical protein I553_6392 [Mycobacterium xenopi 4042]